MDVGNKVRVKLSGCIGIISICDDSELPLKVLFLDGSGDWFRADDLHIVSASSPLSMASHAPMKEKGPMHISIVGIKGYLEDGPTFIQTTAGTTIAELKRLVFEKLGVRPHLQSLILGEVPLQDVSKLLRDYGVQDGDRLLLVKSHNDLNLSFTAEITDYSADGGRFDWEPDWVATYDASVAPATTDFVEMLETFEMRGRKEIRCNQGSSKLDLVEHKPVSWLLSMLNQDDWQEALKSKPEDAGKLMDLVWSASSTLQCHHVTFQPGPYGGYANKKEEVVMQILVDGHMLRLQRSSAPQVICF